MSTEPILSLESIQLVFKKCQAFVKECNEVFGDDHPEIKLYNRLMVEGPTHEKALRKQVEVFEKALSSCVESIKKMDIDGLCEKIAFSSKVFIPIKQLCIESDDSTQQVIFNHLQLIMMLLNPEDSELKTKIMNEYKKEKEEMERKKQEAQSDPEGAFLNNFMGQIENKMSNQSYDNPLQAIGGMFQSGVMFDLAAQIQGGIESGTINLDKLVGKVTSQMNDNQVSRNDVNSMMTMMSTMMGLPTNDGDPLALLEQHSKKP